jgi:serine/threonine-protein kinase
MGGRDQRAPRQDGAPPSGDAAATESQVETHPLIDAQDADHPRLVDDVDERASGVVSPSSEKRPAKQPSPAPLPPPLLSPGDLVDHYEVKQRLGRGAMGEVYLAKDSKLGRKVAIKLLRPELFENRAAVTRFEHEARSLARINHPNVVTIHTVGHHRGMPYVAMEYVKGQALAAQLNEGIDLAQALHIAIEVAKGLREAHGHGIVHRDLKPENVLAQPNGRVVVLDFGLAKMIDLPGEDSFPAGTPMPFTSAAATMAGTTVGTPLYMSPEQWKSDEITTASDVWALGVILFEMLAGRPPFEGVDIADLAIKICNPKFTVTLEEPIPEPVRTLTLSCLRRKPDERPTLEKIIADLEVQRRAISASPSMFPHASTTAVAGFARRNRTALFLAVAGVLLVGGVVLGMAISGSDDAEPSSTTAPIEAATTPPPAEPVATARPEPPVPSAPASTSATAPAPSATATAAAEPPPRPTPAKRRPPSRPKQPADPFSQPPQSAGY